MLMFDVDRVMLMKGQGAGSNVSRCCSPATRVFFIGSGSTRSLQSNRKCFAPRTALFIRTEFKRHPWNVHRNWKLLDPKRVDSKASFAYLTEGKRNPSPLPSLHSYSNFKHLVTRVRINFDCSFQTTKPVQRSNRILFWIYLRSHFFSFESDIDSRHWWAPTKMRSQAQKWRPWRLKGRQFGFRYIRKKSKTTF